MTLIGTRERIAQIKQVAWDDEKAHDLEDELLWEFVEHVSYQKGELGQMARLMLELKNVDFERWKA